MSDFTLSKEEWYQSRDNRTNILSVDQSYQKSKIGIKVDPQVSSSFSIQLMTLVSCNIISRWCRNVTLDLPDCQTILPNQSEPSFHSLLLDIMRSNDPYGTFEIKDSFGDCDQILEIGNISSHHAENVWIHGDGWISGGGTGDNAFSYTQNDNPLGPSFASCLGSSILFQRAINENEKFYPSWHDLFTLRHDQTYSNFQTREFPKILDLGIVHQLGCGAVGSSLDYLISFTRAKGKFVLIDSDAVDYSNCNRSLSFSAYDAVVKSSKTDICKNVLLVSGLDVESHPLKYADFTSKYTDKLLDVDLILCLANEDNIWSSIQVQLPPITLHATTTPSWGVNFGRHIPISEWCILCRFKSHLRDTITYPCETGKIIQSKMSRFMV